MSSLPARGVGAFSGCKIVGEPGCGGADGPLFTLLGLKPFDGARPNPGIVGAPIIPPPAMHLMPPMPAMPA
eukprot:CAMPEP_0119313496 /NCGR_PEP_ID=MMETSP1333-20130426/29314_1 /TAXON_ID=418940 /ORGANISM="Scyphosphaera apsteinii, Strain RCC1455" /LENGTH=70 /DNA_ID=CAMNT_0007318345 /DNA_START=180 /DNA_END=389 /DNA_ORIENTATION=+